MYYVAAILHLVCTYATLKKGRVSMARTILRKVRKVSELVLARPCSPCNVVHPLQTTECTCRSTLGKNPRQLCSHWDICRDCKVELAKMLCHLLCRLR